MRLPFLAVLCAVLLAPASSSGAAEAVRVYPIGDSITYGNTYSLVSTPGGYRGVLDQQLTRLGVAHQFVGSQAGNSTPVLDATGQNHHDGWPGWRVDQIDAAITGWIAGGVTPDVAIVHLGTNDIAQRFDPGTTYPTGDGRVNYGDPVQRATFVAHLTARLQGLVDKLQALRPGVRIAVSDVVPISSAGGTGAPHAATSDYAAAVQGLVGAEQAAGDRVVFASVFARFVAATPNGPVVVPGLLSPDNVHPTPAGYAVMADVYDDAVLAALAA